MADTGSSSGISNSPAPSGGLSTNGDQRRPAPKSQHACVACVRAGVNCDGVRPTCGRCSQQDIDCVYEAESENGDVRDMELRLESANAEIDSLVFLLQAMREGTELEARMLLEQLRACGDIQSFARTMRRRGAQDGAELQS